MAEAEDQLEEPSLVLVDAVSFPNVPPGNYLFYGYHYLFGSLPGSYLHTDIVPFEPERVCSRTPGSAVVPIDYNGSGPRYGKLVPSSG